MARQTKTGLDYFPFDIDFFEDVKIRKLIRRQGGKAITVYALLLCFIYKNGYYIGSDEELPFIISEKTGYDEAYIQEVIKCLFSLGLLDKGLYDREKIMTSKGIQERYVRVQKLCKRPCEIMKRFLISSEEMTISSEETGIISEEMTISLEEMTRKEKEKEIEKEIERDREVNLQPPPLKKNETEKIDFSLVMQLFNETCISFPKISKLANARKRKIARRLSEMDGDIEKLKTVFEKAEKSDFLKGHNQRGWSASFDWIFDNEINWVKILEGNYDNKQKNDTSKQNSRLFVEPCNYGKSTIKI